MSTQSAPDSRFIGGRLLTVQEVANYLAVPVATLYQWRYLHTGPTAYRVGRHIRYDPTAVRAWLDQQES